MPISNALAEIIRSLPDGELRTRLWQIWDDVQDLEYRMEGLKK